MEQGYPPNIRAYVEIQGRESMTSQYAVEGYSGTFYTLARLREAIQDGLSGHPPLTLEGVQYLRALQATLRGIEERRIRPSWPPIDPEVREELYEAYYT